MGTKPITAGSFRYFREIVRDTAHRLGKDVRFHLAGSPATFNDEEFSRLRDAVVQALQNAVDHGIESAALREGVGKSPAGRVWLEFADESDAKIVKIRDDGAGIDLGAVGRKARALGLATPTDTLPTSDLLALLFEPGFSTKSTVTEVSGRGVGLDLVRAVTRSFSGSIEIDTVRGEGTCLTLRFPRKALKDAA